MFIKAYVHGYAADKQFLFEETLFESWGYSQLEIILYSVKF